MPHHPIGTRVINHRFLGGQPAGTVGVVVGHHGDHCNILQVEDSGRQWTTGWWECNIPSGLWGFAPEKAPQQKYTVFVREREGEPLRCIYGVNRVVFDDLESVQRYLTSDQVGDTFTYYVVPLRAVETYQGRVRIS